MIDITHKSTTLREATAQAIVKLGSKETVSAITNNLVPKGNVLEMAKTAGLFAVKKTAEMIPDCHPMPIEFTGIDYQINELEIKILVTVKTIYRTGVEVEAMHAASVVALTLYDMLKPIEKNIEIDQIKLVNKKGGKSDFKDAFKTPIKAAIIVCSDTISNGKKEDIAGKTIIGKLKETNVNVIDYIIIPDEIKKIQEQLIKHAELNTDLLIYTGGTGLSPKDLTPEALIPLLDQEIPGIAEASRKYGQDRTPYAMLSRSVAGIREKTLVLALPGSTRGAAESIDALFPSLLHIFRIMKGARHWFEKWTKILRR